ncbi:Rho guanine nucleotide exchange factor [Rhynchospora pubera]|uniref:Rho guanine nucleotide exchange factor n=2 Tax=Rhynchospora pubera TaxID=906938 RepID=A0AAV8I0I4_9POAL|nr:Rho guanine nucleotide exchange factor [Rhynchospora pubera]
MTPPTVKDVLAFHKIDRAVYEKFVAHGLEPGRARNVVALFMWLEERIDVINQIVQIINPTMIVTLIAEADAVLHCLQQDDGQSNYIEIPMITSLAKNRLDIRYFNYNKDETVRGLAHILDRIGRLLFDDHMYELLRAYESEEAAVRAGLSAVRPVVPPALAMLYAPGMGVPIASTEDARSMVITFSKGFPIGREEIWEHLTMRWGDCIEKVMMERVPPGGTILPMYGRVVFKTDTYINLLLDGERVSMYNINGRHLWARNYVPTPTVSVN